MKNIAKTSTTYYSAYPLKAVEKPVPASSDLSQQSPYLQALLAGQRKTNTELRVYPMRNPYQEPAKPLTSRPQPLAEKEPQGNDWFNHYE